VLEVGGSYGSGCVLCAENPELYSRGWLQGPQGWVHDDHCSLTDDLWLVHTLALVLSCGGFLVLESQEAPTKTTECLAG
jgi:hypothetical protein